MNHDIKADPLARVTRMIGVGADNGDGHIRLTEGGQYRVVQGSEQSHEAMLAWCEGINQRLASMNKRMDELTTEEFMELARQAAPRV